MSEAMVSLLGPFGWLSQQPDGKIESRPASDAPGDYEKFKIVGLPEPAPQPPTPTPQPPNPQPQPPSNDPHAFFLSCVDDYGVMSWPQTPEGRDSAQKIVLNLFNPEKDGRLLNAGWLLTPPNQNGEQTKVLPPGSVWTRVGFGEGFWVWLPQS